MSQSIRYPNTQAAVPYVLFASTPIMHNIKFNKSTANPENPTQVGENAAFFSLK